MNGKHILIADEAEDFADSILRLLNDKDFARKLTINCHSLNNSNFSIETLVIEAEKIMEYINHD